MSARALAMAKKALNAVHAEYKFIDGSGVEVQINTQPLINQLTNLVQGDTDQTRTGSQINISSILIRGFAEINSAATASYVRVQIVQDKQTNGSIYSGADLLADATAGESVISPLNLDNKYRFKILWDHCYQMPFGNASLYINKYIKCNIPIRFDGITGTISDLTSNSLSLVFTSNEVTDVPLMTFYTRLRFLDN